MSAATPMKLYHYPISGASRGALLAARAIGVPVQIETVTVFQKEHLKDDLLKVPTLDDDGLFVRESRAIAVYLVDKYGQDDHLYPKDLKRRAGVNQRLYFDSSSLYAKILGIVFPILFMGETEINEPRKNKLNVTLGLLDGFLSSSKWVAGDNTTIADTSIYASVSSILAVGWDISAFPNIQRWVRDCATLPGYEENQQGAEQFGEAVKINLKH